MFKSVQVVPLIRLGNTIDRVLKPEPLVEVLAISHQYFSSFACVSVSVCCVCA